jgi:PAS domain S-box-containing protein
MTIPPEQPERRRGSRETEEALRSTEKRLQLALSGARAGVWEWNLATQEVSWSPELYDLLGLERGSVEPSGGRFMEVVHPDDREAILARFAGAAEHGGPFAFEFRALRADGTEMWISCFGSIEPDSKGTSALAIGINQDITERKRTEVNARFLLELDTALAPLSDADEIEQMAVDRLGAHLGVEHCYFGQLNGKRVAILHEYRRGENSVLGEYDLDDFFKPEARERIIQGGAIVVEDVTTNAYTSSSLESYAAFGIGAVLAVPVKYHDRWVGSLSCLSHVPRAWRPDELRLMQDLAARVWPLIEQARAAQALRAADQRKDEFLAMLAHELRNPLAPIRNAVQVLKLVGPADANQQWAREVIERQVQHLARLVDDLLDVSRFTQGKVKIACEPLDLATIIQRAVEASRPLIDARHHQLSVALPPEPVRLEGDLTRLVQVVGNLLNNAAKYTDEGGSIHLEATREGAEAVIRVRDNGMGLPADLLPHVFDLFTQADRSLDRSQGGLGIGLTLVRQLIRLHGGRVEARSEGPGRGSEFIVRLPAEAEAAAADAQESAGEGDRPAASGLKILLVEDSVDSAEMMAFILQLGGHDVRIAHDGPAALEAARAFQPEVVLCDIGLPGMNGYEVATRLREQPAFQRTPLIALTGYGQDEARSRSREAGFDVHLVKPVEPDALEALLGTLRPSPTRA